MSNVSFSVNDHFYDFIGDWSQKFYFLVGGYGSSKSYHVAIKLITKLLQEKRKALVVREVFETMRDSCYSLLEEVALAMGLNENVIKFSTSPMQAKFQNGSKIIFKGMDKPGKLKSINGVSIIWVEECSEVKYEGIKELLGRLRHPTVSNHIIYSTNPVSKSNWCYKHFFEDKRNKRFVLSDKELYKKRIIIKNNTYYHHSTADDNYFLPEDYIKQLDEMREYDPDLYRIARKGQFGVNGLKVLPQFIVKPSDWIKSNMKCVNSKIYRVGMDFGFETSYNAVIRLLIDDTNKDLYIYWCYYKNQMTDDRTAIDIEEFKQTKELIRADSAEPKTIAFYNQEGFRMIGAKKGGGSRLENTKKVKRFRHIYCSDDCQPVIDELEELVYATDKNGEIIEDEFNIDPHTFSAIWYALDGYNVADIKQEKFNKGIGKGIKNNSNTNNDRRTRGGNVF